jgi:NADH-quinone oxidoreductase subunit N
LLAMDAYALFYIGLLSAATMVVVVMSYGYLERMPGNREEFYLLLTLATFGCAVLAASNHFVSFFLGLEILSVSLYGLVAYLRTTRTALESGIKYLILAAASAAFLLFGMALIYADLGTMDFTAMASMLSGKTREPTLLLGGFGMVVIGAGFKLAVVPFHMWAPDVYQGAPTPVTAYLTTVSKGAMVALLLRYGRYGGLLDYDSVVTVLGIIAVASMFLGNLLALFQENIKRLLAYSSIAHLGYLLVAVVAASREGSHAVTFYLVAYFITSLGIFGIITALSDERKEADEVSDYRGLFWRRPWVSGALTLMLFSLAGIPLTAGFVGKFYVLTAGVLSDLWTLVILLVVSSVIGLYYYLRIIITMYLPAPEDPSSPLPATRRFSLPEGLVLAALTVLVIWFGVYPAPLLDVIQAAVGSLA